MSHLDFALAVHRVVAENPTVQVCWSPFSAASALTLLTRGARGQTEAELRALLGDLDETTRVLTAASTLDEPWQGQETPAIAVANTLWADAAIDIDPGFTERLADLAGTVRNAPFLAEPEKARADINADVAETTRGLIPELLPAGSIRSDTVSTVVNALYLKSSWLHKFDPEEGESPFATPVGSVNLPMMRVTGELPYVSRGGWQAIGIPAVGAVQAVVLLPEGPFAPAEANLTGDSLAALFAALEPTQVHLRMPKLDISTQADLTGPLNQLGVTTVFTPAADLSAISSAPLYAQSILHESVLRVDENGLEGAAATAGLIGLMSIPPKPIDITVDRPFLLVVRHRTAGAVYFLARVTDPS
ncbi:serpin family protein [Actinokineospora inagensis]|uniref:serpin family protein n=1 Tax=Actinokineospora inagensis TaxID=103730 RepID=UPI0004051E56|nr:serpin family protein [Actinokineospora inagensis]